MRLSPTHIAPCIAFLLLASPAIAFAQESTGADEQVQETIEVKRAEEKSPKHKSLQFLKDNRVFLREQLDRLRVHITRVRSDEAEIIDGRYLQLKEMSAAIAAASDTVRSEHAHTTDRERLDSVTELGDLENELTLMERLLAEQRRRLLLLEEDFLGHQETALVILVRGFAGGNVPGSIELREDSDVVRVELTPEQRASLAQGGIAQVYHEFVEPRAHVYDVRFRGGVWETSQPVAVTFEAARDRITFLELDLSQLDLDREAGGLLTSVWYR